VAQVISWGSLYYAIAVLGESMRQELGVSQPVLFGAFTCGLVVSGLVAPFAGRQIDQRGGRAILSLGSFVAALAMLALAASQGPWTMGLGWILAGVAMAMTLYDPAFATLHRLQPHTYRRAVTTLTLFGGFASTVFWPLSGALLNSIGWRGAFLCFALLHLAVCTPVHLLVIPRDTATLETRPSDAAPHAAAPGGNALFYWLAVAFALASLLVGGLSVHLIELLKSGGLSASDAVWVGACIGPMQVTGRVLEFALSGRTRAIHVGYAAFGLLIAAMSLLAFVGNNMAAGVVFAMLYGMSNGILTIVRGIAPAEIIGGTRIGAMLGRLGLFSFIARAIAPLSFALLLSSSFRGTQLVVLCAIVAVMAGFCFTAAATQKPAPALGV
jgi:predicted MFS family arabinose efflux permease